jgi:hypothetical protein
MNFKLSSIQSSGAPGMDAFFESEPQIVSPVGTTKVAAPQRVKVSSLQQLGSFQRISSDTLVHKSTNDLWALRKDGEEYYIERLFQDNGSPLKG